MEVDFHILKRADRRPGALLLPPSVRARYGYKRRDFLLGEDRLASEAEDGINLDPIIQGILQKSENLSRKEVEEFLASAPITAQAYLKAAIPTVLGDRSLDVQNTVRGMVASSDYSVNTKQLLQDGLTELGIILTVGKTMAMIPDPTGSQKFLAGTVIAASLLYFAVTDWDEFKKLWQSAPEFRNWIEAWRSDAYGCTQGVHEQWKDLYRPYRRDWQNDARAIDQARRAVSYNWNASACLRLFQKMKTDRDEPDIYPFPAPSTGLHATPFEQQFRALLNSNAGAGQQSTRFTMLDESGKELYYPGGEYNTGNFYPGRRPFTLPRFTGRGWKSIHDKMHMAGDELAIVAALSLFWRQANTRIGLLDDSTVPQTSRTVAASADNLIEEWGELEFIPSGKPKIDARGYDGEPEWHFLQSKDYRDIYAASTHAYPKIYGDENSPEWASSLRFFYLNDNMKAQMPIWLALPQSGGGSDPLAFALPGLHGLMEFPGVQKFDGMTTGLIRAKCYEMLGNLIEKSSVVLIELANEIERTSAKTWKNDDVVLPQDIMNAINAEAIVEAVSSGDPKGVQAVKDGIRRQPGLVSILNRTPLVTPPPKSSGAGLAIAAAALYALSQG